MTIALSVLADIFVKTFFSSFPQDTNQSFYKPFGIKYKGLQLLDVAQCNIAMYFPECAEFIDEALKSGGTKVYDFVSVCAWCVCVYVRVCVCLQCVTDLD